MKTLTKAKHPTFVQHSIIVHPLVTTHLIQKINFQPAIFLATLDFIVAFLARLASLASPACLTCLACLVFPVKLQALTFDLPATGNRVGENLKVKSKQGDTLFSLAQSHDIGVQEMESVNPKLHLNTKLPLNTEVNLPIAYVLPNVPRKGIVLNLAQMRIFYYSSDGKQVSTYPVGIGKQGWSTPTGLTTVVIKEKDPAWHPPASLRQEAASRGKHLPLVVPPGPNNPLGKYALRLGFTNILIHGTNQPASIGLRSSHGCIRMYPKNIEELFSQVEVNTPVNIISEPK